MAELSKEEIITGKELDEDLKKVVKGTGIIFFGSILGTILGLVGTILIARFYSVEEFGFYGLITFIVTFFIAIASLGLLDGCPRYISYYRGKQDDEKIKGTINASFIIISISSAIVTILLFFSADFISNQIFKTGELSILIKIVVIGLPFWILILLIISIFRGFESVKEKVYFEYFLLGFIKIPLFVGVIALGLTFNYILAAYTFSIIFTFLIAIFYLIKKLPEKIKKVKNTVSQTKTLLLFSWPLVFTELGFLLLSGSDKIMLGILATKVELGTYTTSVTIVQYLNVFLVSSVFIFTPIASRLFAEHKMDELKRYYQILTKWLFTLTFPFIIAMFLFPKTIISILFGERYILAATALQIFVIAYSMQVFLGPSIATIIVFGKTKIIMYFTLIGGLTNIVLNYLLIPLYGIEGAAFSTTISLIFTNALFSAYLFRLSRIHSIRKKFVFPVILSVSVLIVFYYFVGYFQLETFSLLIKILICLLLVIFYFIVIIVSKSFDHEDLSLLLFIERKIGINLGILKRIIKKLI